MSPQRAIWAYVLTVVVAAVAAYPLLVGDYGPFSRGDLAAGLLLFVASPAAESLVVHIHFRKSAHSFSLLELPLTVGVLTIHPFLVVTAYGLGSGLVLLMRRRQPPVKLVFNSATFVLTATVAVALYRVLPTSDSLVAPVTWLSAGGAVLFASLLGTGLVVGVISVAERRIDSKGVLTALLWGFSTAAGGISLGIAAAILASESLFAVVFVTAPLLAIFAANRAYESEHQRRRSLEVVFDTSRTLTDEVESETALYGVLNRFHQSTSSDFAAIYLEQGSQDILCLTTDEAGQHRQVVSRAMAGPLMDLAIRRGRAWLLSPDLTPAVEFPEDAASPDDLTVLMGATGQSGITEALLAPLMDDGRSLGVVVVGSSGKSFRRLGQDDLALFETVCRSIASHTRLSRGALQDPLTGLANRRQIMRRLETLFEADGQAGYALLLIDLDDFKGINDTFGHAVGDAVLSEIGQRLRRVVPESWVAARLGGDEFAILGPTESVAYCAARGEEALAALSAQIEVGSHAFQVRASIGLALGADADSPATLLRNADTALYEAKSLGKGQLMVFNQPMFARAARRYRLGEALRDALQADELDVVFQPVVSLTDGSLSGAEALARWEHPDFGAVPPEEFVGIAEDMNLSALLATRVLAAVERAFRGTPGSLSISMNVSPGDLGDAEFVSKMVEVAGNLRPHILGVEVTERMLLSHREAPAALRRLREGGVRIYVDDFGTGYSSLAYLKDLPLDYLKIPREFVRDVESGTSALAVVQGVVALGHALGLIAVAEGIETVEQARLLAESGASLGQGYLFDRPLCIHDFLERVGRSATNLSSAA